MKRILDLNGLWRFAPWPEARPTNNHNLLQTDVPLYALPELDRRDWTVTRVPGVWERIAEKYSIYEGICWYCRSFAVPALGKDARAFLRFGGVSYLAEVYVNGRKAGAHASAYTAFTLDVTDLLREGENFLAVSADNRPLMVRWPTDRGYFSYGGIHRDVTLEIYEGAYIEDLSVTPVWEDGAVLSVSGTLHGDSRAVSAVLDGTVQTKEASADESGRFSETFRFPDALPWSPDDPALYTLVIGYGEDRYELGAAGFKKLAVADGRLFLNGKPFHINGTSYVYDSPTEGLVMTKEQLAFDLSEMKEAGVNFIRTHYAMDEKFYALCDEMGFLVWIEANIYCTKPKAEETNTPFAAPAYVADAETNLTEMIAAARRYVCVGIYGIGNECNVEHPEAKVFFPRMAALVRKTDGSRLVGYAALGTLVGDMGDCVDILGTNGYYGWYTRVGDLYAFRPKAEEAGKTEVETVDLAAFHANIKVIAEKVPKRVPLLLTEFGADSIPGFHSAAAELWSEEYHEKVVEEMIKASRMYDRICGTFVFTFTDHMDPCKPQNGWWNGQNLKGMLSYNRDRKRPFYALQRVYKEEKTCSTKS